MHIVTDHPRDDRYFPDMGTSRRDFRFLTLEAMGVASEKGGFSHPEDPCMEYLPTLGLFKITLGVNVGKYSIHGSSGP